jgi:catechol 2,3-dioxygenase-like lactoylglutathione lyase family enzyme
MEHALGIGGVFLRFRNRDATARWYRENLGLDVNAAWHGVKLPLRHPDDRPGACVVWAAFPEDTDYFGDRSRQCMINFRVRDLDAMLAQLRAAGCAVDEKVDRSEYGAFGWVADPEGNRIELWQPPDTAA